MLNPLGPKGLIKKGIRKWRLIRCALKYRNRDTLAGGHWTETVLCVLSRYTFGMQFRVFLAHIFNNKIVHMSDKINLARILITFVENSLVLFS